MCMYIQPFGARTSPSLRLLRHDSALTDHAWLVVCVQIRETKAMRLAPRWAGVPQPFGSPYTCALTDTVTEVQKHTPLLLDDEYRSQNSLTDRVPWLLHA